MANGIVFWGVVTICAGFYFDWTDRGLQVAGQPEAAAANSVALVMLVIPAFAMFLREALRLLRR